MALVLCLANSRVEHIIGSLGWTYAGILRLETMDPSRAEVLLVSRLPWIGVHLKSESLRVLTVNRGEGLRLRVLHCGAGLKDNDPLLYLLDHSWSETDDSPLVGVR